MENNENRFNKKAARWHECLWFLLVSLVFWAWVWLLTGCGSSKKLVQTKVVQDSMAVNKTLQTDDSTSHDSVVLIKASDKYFSDRVDSTVLSQVIERNTIIRQDADGKEISREVSTTITNNREHTQNNNLSRLQQESQIQNVDNTHVRSQKEIIDSISKALQQNPLYEHPKVESKPSFWQRCMHVVWGLLRVAWCCFCVLLGWLGINLIAYFARKFRTWCYNRRRDDEEKKKES